jgi:hypothetical protein
MVVGALYRPLHPKSTEAGSTKPRSRSDSSAASASEKNRIGDIATLRRQGESRNRSVNRDQVTIKWKFTRKLARLKLNYSFTRSKY